MQQKTQQDGEDEQTQKGQQQDEPQLRVNRSGRLTDALLVTVVGLRRSCTHIQICTFPVADTVRVCVCVVVQAFFRSTEK